MTLQEKEENKNKNLVGKLIKKDPKMCLLALAKKNSYKELSQSRNFGLCEILAFKLVL